MQRHVARLGRELNIFINAPLIRHEKEHIDFNHNIWTVPKEISNTRKAIVRPLAPQALKIIKWKIVYVVKLPILYCLQEAISEI